MTKTVSKSWRGSAACEGLLGVLRTPSSISELSLGAWDQLLPIARDAGLVGRIAALARQTGAWQTLPEEPRRHLLWSERDTTCRERILRWELECIAEALSKLDIVPVLLKGAAYVVAGIAPYRGRMPRDVDLLVPIEAIGDVEQALLDAGWISATKDMRHDLYFRRWLHELPPLIHRERKLMVDVHHTIIPRTDTLRVDPRLLLDAATEVPEDPRWKVLSPADMVLHAAAHLFRNGDFSHGLRDLYDLHQLLVTFGTEPGFWTELEARSQQLDLRLPLSCAARYCTELFGTPISESLDQCLTAPRWPMGSIVDGLVPRAVLPRTLDRDWQRHAAISALSYWPLPRFRAIASTLFWTKRLPRKRVTNE